MLSIIYNIMTNNPIFCNRFKVTYKPMRAGYLILLGKLYFVKVYTCHYNKINK